MVSSIGNPLYTFTSLHATWINVLQRRSEPSYIASQFTACLWFLGESERMVRWWFKSFVVPSCLLLSYQQDSFSQPPQYQGLRARQSPRTTFNITLGLTSPQGRDGLREFWLNGPGGSGEFLIHLNPLLAVGIGADMSLLYFDERAFFERWPRVPLVEKKNLFVGNVYLAVTSSFFPGRPIHPFLSVQGGAEFISEALYREVIGGVRHTYYDVGGTARLALGLATGASFSLNYNLSILVELKGTFINNDPDVSMLAHGRVGIQFKL